MTNENRIAIAAPREHAKTTWFSLVYPLWCILNKKKKFILILSDTQSQAKDLLGAIVQELETNERIISDYGNKAGYVPPRAEDKKKWSMDEIVTLDNIKVQAKGWKSKLRGIKFGAQRPDLILIDDLENDEQVASDNQRAKLKSIFNKSILNLGSKNTQILYIGTILHFDSLLNNLIEDPPPNWKTKLYQAYKNNKPLWPEWWNIDRLEAKKAEIGSLAFEQEYMNNPLDPETQIAVPKAFYTQYDPDLHNHYTYLDLAISEKDTADYTAAVTIAKHKKTGLMKVVEPVALRTDVNGQLDLIIELYNRYNSITLGFEEVAYQKAIGQMVKREMPAWLKEGKINKPIPIKGIPVDKDKVRRLIQITPYIENEMIEFNKSHQDFLMQLKQFPKASHDDLVDAFVGAVNLAIQKGTNTKTYVGGGINYPT